MKVGGVRGAAGDGPRQLGVMVRGKDLLYLLLRKAEITSGGGEKNC